MYRKWWTRSNPYEELSWLKLHLKQENYTAQSQSYGPEARGGLCTEVLVPIEDEIGYTKVQNPSYLLRYFNLDSLEKYAKSLIVIVLFWWIPA